MIGTSVHAVEEVALAQNLGATYLIAGHIFQTDCKADLKPRGISFYQKGTKRITYSRLSHWRHT